MDCVFVFVSVCQHVDADDAVWFALVWSLLGWQRSACQALGGRGRHHSDVFCAQILIFVATCSLHGPNQFLCLLLRLRCREGRELPLDSRLHGVHCDRGRGWWGDLREWVWHQRRQGVWNEGGHEWLLLLLLLWRTADGAWELALGDGRSRQHGRCVGRRGGGDRCLALGDEGVHRDALEQRCVEVPHGAVVADQRLHAEGQLGDGVRNRAEARQQGRIEVAVHAGEELDAVVAADEPRAVSFYLARHGAGVGVAAAAGRCGGCRLLNQRRCAWRNHCGRCRRQGCCCCRRCRHHRRCGGCGCGWGAHCGHWCCGARAAMIIALLLLAGSHFARSWLLLLLLLRLRCCCHGGQIWDG
mmetsp:Transcript_5828/g.17379  ORF Transcript_5828/g.17379 Transcript_5828/m.17379 type:complete len:357 (+) Transcript_5828:1581-2651(+)